MDKHYSDDTFLARWISDDLSQEEIEVFKKSDDYSVFKKINEASQTLEAPHYNKEEQFSKIQSKKPNYQVVTDKSVKFIPNWAYAVAASVVITISIFYTLNISSNYETAFSQQLAVTLPDNSAVKLNANSQLEFKSFNWKSEREVMLHGEAFFDVEKGKSFKVITKEGAIEVLGTEFNIVSRDNYFQVECHEGKVKVSSYRTNNETILLPGDAIRFVNDNPEVWNFDESEPNWLRGESSFVDTPIGQVVIAIENQFGIKFDMTGIDTTKRFTGSFTHKDINLALKTVLIPMDISYSSNSRERIILTDTKNKI